MNKERRLQKKADFLVVQRQGRWWSNPLLIVRVLPNQLGLSRFGFLVSKRIGNAVKRNLVKRRLREVVRKEPIPEGWDMVFIARSGLNQATFSQTTDSVRDLLRRTKLTTPPPKAVAPGIEEPGADSRIMEPPPK